MSVLIVGGGIAGHALAWTLARRGQRPVTLLEREPLAFAHSSSRNAAIYRPLEDSVWITRLAKETLALLPQLGTDLLRKVGLLLTSQRADALTGHLRTAQEEDVECAALDRHALVRQAPVLAGGSAHAGLWLPSGGVLDIHSLTQALSARARTLDVQVLTNAHATRWTRKGRLFEVHLVGGEVLTASRLVLAAGAWTERLAASGQCDLSLVPHRRHLVHLVPSAPVSATHPICWDIDHDVYFRPESGGILASPGDHQPTVPGLPSVEPEMLVVLAKKLAQLAPALAGCEVRRPWACLRTMTTDRHMALGPDPRMADLWWFAGLAGHGMTCGLAAAERLADAMLGTRSLPQALDVRRLLPGAFAPTDSPNPMHSD